MDEEIHILKELIENVDITERMMEIFPDGPHRKKSVTLS